jgi:5-methyltetrahydropteroyltriglutamate--homocysteine methyltransferase
MLIPTEPIGSIPRSPQLLEALASHNGADPALDPLYEGTALASAALGPRL